MPWKVKSAKALDCCYGDHFLQCLLFGTSHEIDEKQNCLGHAIKLDHKEIKEANMMLNDQIEGEWRLPNRKELESLICEECKEAKINEELFPNTPAEPFWTSQRNWWSPKFFWSVNFFTGHSYGRFVPEKKLFTRFVRDR